MRVDLFEALAKVASVAVTMAATDPHIERVAPGAANDVVPIVRDVAAKTPELYAAQRAVDEATKPVPFWQSSVLIGQFVAAVSLFAGLMGYRLDESTQKDIVELLGLVGIIAGQGITIYGRLSSNAAPITAKAA